jgi:tetratricopeptide (TPR) repeat protein
MPTIRVILPILFIALVGGNGCAWIKNTTRSSTQKNNPASIHPATGIRPSTPRTEESELQNIFIADNTAITEVVKWIEENPALIRSNSNRRERLAQRIRIRLDRVRKMYLAFLEKHPNNARARAAYGSFLTHLDDQQGALRQLKASAKLAPFNAAVHNNIATHLGTIAVESGRHTRVGEVLEAYQKSIQLAPRSPLYRHNYAIALSLFQKKAAAHLKLTPREVSEEALKQITEALQLDPNNFEIAADLAETHHDFKPLPHEQTLAAWKHAAKLATTEDERSWAELQMAIVNIEINHFDEAKRHLGNVDVKIYAKLKQRLLNAIERTPKQKPAKP